MTSLFAYYYVELTVIATSFDLLCALFHFNPFYFHRQNDMENLAIPTEPHRNIWYLNHIELHQT